MIRNHGLLYLHGPTLHILKRKRKDSGADISNLTAYQLTPITIIKRAFHKTKNEEVYIRVIARKRDA